MNTQFTVRFGFSSSYAGAERWVLNLKPPSISKLPHYLAVCTFSRKKTHRCLRIPLQGSPLFPPYHTKTPAPLDLHLYAL